MANVTITTAANYIREVWPSAVLEDLHKNLVIAPLMWREWERFLADGGGDKINVPSFAEVTARKLTSMTGTLTFDAATEATTQITIDTLAYFASKVDFAALKQANVPILEISSREAARSIAQQVDTDCLTEMDTATQVVGTDNVDLTDTNVRRSRQYLDDANADTADRFMAVSPATLMSFMDIEKYTANLYTASIGNFDGKKGRGFAGNVYGLDLYETTNLPVGTAGKKNFAWQREFVSLTMQKEIFSDTAEPHDEFALAIRAYAMYGVKKMRNTVGVEMDGK